MVEENNTKEFVYVLRLVSIDENQKIALLREIRSIRDCDLSTGKQIVETSNSIILTTKDENTANSIKNRLERFGAKVSISKDNSSDSNIGLNNMQSDVEEIAKSTIIKNITLIVFTIATSLYIYNVHQGKLILYLTIALILLRICMTPITKTNRGMKFLINTYLFVYGLFLLPMITYPIFWLGVYLVFIAPSFDFLVLLSEVSTNAENREESEKQKLITDNGLHIDKIVKIGEDLEILVDVNKQKIIFRNNSTLFHEFSQKMFDFKDIYDFDLVEDGYSKLQGRGMVSAVGALTFGIAGAIVGTVAGDRKSINHCSSLYVNVSVNDVDFPLITVGFLNEDVEKSSTKYQKALRSAQELTALLTFVQNRSKNK